MDEKLVSNMNRIIDKKYQFKKTHDLPPSPDGNRVLIGIPTADTARSWGFIDHIDLMDKPIGTLITKSHGQSPARNRNIIIKQALEVEATHVFFVDDDMIFPPNTLNKLLKHDLDIVTGLYLMRNHPHLPVMFDLLNEEGKCAFRPLNDNDHGLVEIVSAGLGCCLIKTDVFRAIRKMTGDDYWVTLGEFDKDHWCDDHSFFKRARQAGFRMYCDLDTPAGHEAKVIVWPNKINGVWHTAYDTNGREIVNTPQHNKRYLVGPESDLGIRSEEAKALVDA